MKSIVHPNIVNVSKRYFMGGIARMGKRIYFCVGTEIPVTGFSGKALELRAKMKMQEVKRGAAGLLLRIDGRNSFSNIPGQEHLYRQRKVLAFDNMLQKNIQGTRDWPTYSIKLPFPKNASEIYIGAILTGKGKL